MIKRNTLLVLKCVADVVSTIVKKLTSKAFTLFTVGICYVKFTVDQILNVLNIINWIIDLDNNCAYLNG